MKPLIIDKFTSRKCNNITSFDRYSLIVKRISKATANVSFAQYMLS
jgi:hypothetical protein